MKKTIIAASIAAVVAAPAAFADVSVSGNVYGEATDSDAQVFTDLFFKASEDLGNGLKVSSVIQIVGDNASQATTGAIASTDQTGTLSVGSQTAGERSVSLAGDFGTIQAGRMEANIENKVWSMAANDPSHQASIETSGNQVWIAGVRYTTPSFNGISAVYETDQADFTGFGVNYSGHGVTAKYAKEDNGTDEFTSWAIKYGMNGLNATYAVLDNTTDDVKDSYMGVDYTMGAIKVAYAQVSGDTNDGDSTMSVAYSLSKSTTAYIAADKDDSADDTTTVFGLVQKF
jgi:hypothetical protein